MTAVVLNGNTYSDDEDADTGLGNGGARTRLIPMLSDTVVEVERAVDAADEAAASALTAVNAPGTQATSTTSNSITGAVGTTKTFQIQSGKAIVPGMNVTIARTSAAATQSMTGTVVDYSGTALQVAIASIVGSGTGITDWTIHLSATGGIPASRAISPGGLVTGGGDLSADRTLTVTAASAAEIRAGTSTTVVPTPAGIAAALDFVALTDAATIACDFATFKNATVTLGGNRTLGNPTNVKPGYDAGTIEVVQDGTGNRDLAFASNWVREGGAPDMPTGAGEKGYIHYLARSATVIVYTFSNKPVN